MTRERRITDNRGAEEPLRPGASGIAPRERPEQLKATAMLLAAVIFMIAVVFGVGTALYLLPQEHLQIAELQTAVQVVRQSNFPVRGSRTVTWGDRTILVIHVEEGRYVALAGIGPSDGCILRWNPDSQRIVSPCRNTIFDLNGRVVRGLTVEPLQRYVVYLRGAYVYVTG